ncbi:MAG: protein-disulfide reductase DsbD family protein [Proteobacteria bacterium]|nr:protein-disulfide reductase DsbD family protein [Pseudomonadota bacterium]
MQRQPPTPVSRSAAAFALLLAALLPAAVAWAAAGDWVDGPHSRARLVAAAPSVDGRTVISAGVHLALEPGWETYWRSPGDAGVPPTFDWRGSVNVMGATVSWPTPQKFTTFGMTTWGYLDEVVFPVELAVADPAQPVRIDLALTYAVCMNICIPVSATLTLDLPAAGGGSGEAAAALIERFRARVPAPATFAGMSVERATLTNGAVPTLEILVRANEPLREPDVILESGPGLSFGPPSVRLVAGGRRAILLVAVTGDEVARAGLVANPLTVTLVDGERAIERTLDIDIAD